MAARRCPSSRNRSLRVFSSAVASASCDTRAWSTRGRHCARPAPSAQRGPRRTVDIIVKRADAARGARRETLRAASRSMMPGRLEMHF